MTKLRLEITKGEAIRYISHLDYSRSMERALRRAKLPMAYSEGFNPHMKMAFASALSVGVTSEAEYLEVEISGEVSAADFAAALQNQLPAGITLRRIREVGAKQAALMAVVNLATYRIVVPLAGDGSGAAAKECVSLFNQAEKVIFVKQNPKGKREIDVKQFVPEPIGLEATARRLQLELAIRITPAGSVKPSEVLQVLNRDFGMAVEASAALIHRTALFVSDGCTRLSPMDI